MSETPVERTKLVLMEGIDRLVRSGYKNYRQAALAIEMEPERLYGLRYRDPSFYSLVWLIDTANRLGGCVSVSVEPRASSTSSLIIQESPPTNALPIAGAIQP